MGSYCPVNTTSDNQYLCPIGTYSSFTGLYSISECQPCTAGYFCASVGLTSPSGICRSGYYCGGGSNSSSPITGLIDSNDTLYLEGYSISSSNGSCVKITNNTLNNICPPGKNN